MMVDTVVTAVRPPGPAGGTGSVMSINGRGVWTTTAFQHQRMNSRRNTVGLPVPGAVPTGGLVDTAVGPVRMDEPVYSSVMVT